MNNKNNMNKCKLPKPRTIIHKKPLILPTIKINKSELHIHSKKKKTNFHRRSVTNITKNPKNFLLKINKSESSIIQKSPRINLYKNLQEEITKQNEEIKKVNIKTEPSTEEPKKIFYPISQNKVDLSQIAKPMIPKIDDIAEFEREIQHKHKNLFENIDPLNLYNKKEKKVSFVIPKMLYEDEEYFIQRFGKKKPFKRLQFSDGNMIYADILDYNDYVIKIKELLKLFKDTNFFDNALDFKNSFYEEILTQIEHGKNPKIITFPKKAEGKNSSLYEKYQKFLNRQQKKEHTNENTSNIMNSRVMNRDSIVQSDDSKLLSIFKKKMTKNSKLKQVCLSSEINNTYSFINNTILNKDPSNYDSASDKESSESASPIKLENKKLVQKQKRRSTIFFRNDPIESRLDEEEDSFLDNSYIFEKNPTHKDNQTKFGLKIKKEIQIEKKKDKSLYEQFFMNKMNKNNKRRNKYIIPQI